MTHPNSDPRLHRVISVANGKGGVGKTSICANVAGSAAAGQVKVLAIDWDPQGNLGDDLGLTDTQDDDQGRAVMNALQFNEPLPTPVHARENLDVLIGGKWLANLVPLETVGQIEGGLTAVLRNRLAELATDYDLVFFDCPPEAGALVEAAYGASRYILVPTKHDKGSHRGLFGVGRIKARAQVDNPDLDWLGAVLFDHNANATRMKARTYARLDEISDRVPIFDAFVRSSPKAAQDSREVGKLVREMAEDIGAQQAQTLAALRRPRHERTLPAYTFTRTSEPLANDYLAITQELLARIRDHEAGKHRGHLQVVGS